MPRHPSTRRISSVRPQSSHKPRAARAPPPSLPRPAPPRPDSTHPASPIMKGGGAKGFVQAYNGQGAVDSQAQVVVAAAVTQEANDKRQRAPMPEQVRRMTGRQPQQATADSGYFSEAAVTDPK